MLAALGVRSKNEKKKERVIERFDLLKENSFLT